MDHAENNQNLSPEEKKFNEYLSRGDDFMKIELFRNAKLWYKKALELNPSDPVAQQKFNDVSIKLKNESRVIFTLFVIAAVIVGIVVIIKSL